LEHLEAGLRELLAPVGLGEEARRVRRIPGREVRLVALVEGDDARRRVGLGNLENEPRLPQVEVAARALVEEAVVRPDAARPRPLELVAPAGHLRPRVLAHALALARRELAIPDLVERIEVELERLALARDGVLDRRAERAVGAHGGLRRLTIPRGSDKRRRRPSLDGHFLRKSLSP